MNLAFEFDALGPAFAKSGGDDDRGFHPGVNAFADDLGNGVGGRGHDRQIYFVGNGGNAGVCLEPANFGVARIDGIHVALKGRMPQVFEHGSSDRARAFGGPNHSHGSGQK